MSETNVPYGTGAGSQRAWAPGSTGGDAGSDTTGVKDRASEAASRVGDAGRETAHDAKERARDVAHEATDRARGLVDRTRTELSSQMESQQQHLAGGLRSLGDELNQMAGGTQDPGYATDLVQRAGEASGHVAQWFEDRQPTDVLHEVEDFARRRPGTFVLLAAGAGLLVGRFLRGAKDASGQDDEAARRDPGTSGGSYGGGNAWASSAGGAGGTDAGGLSGTGAGAVGSGAQGGEPDIGRSGAFPAMANDNLPQDPQVPTTAGETPPVFPPPTTPGGTRPRTTGGEHDVERP
ncbi:hypothetical protein APR04_001097 [Promicromonospora umidemergens]|uniref:DUF3618 domain-containing protein n=1 Tax=Promicromonospora umidemergens TaxID=629679 RepID=A0ABP8XMI1_9MICO|nr:hypothetical protein [Promicromonospora umidemergens]MCP2282202.1 hypothetical protein [Promicromonospora umidemergens]